MLLCCLKYIFLCILCFSLEILWLALAAYFIVKRFDNVYLFFNIFDDIDLIIIRRVFCNVVYASMKQCCVGFPSCEKFLKKHLLCD